MIPKNTKSQTIGQSIGIENQEPEQAGELFNEPRTNTNDWLKKILDTPTGEGSVENYDNHPLNFTKTRGMSHILRGITGFLGNLNKAIVDIGVGITREAYDRYFKRGKIKVTEKTANGGAANAEPREL